MITTTTARMASLYCDGSVVGQNPSPIGGAWAWCLISDDQMLMSGSGFVKAQEMGGMVTNNQTELLAMVRGLQAIPPYKPVLVCSDSQVTLGRMFGPFSWKGVPLWLFDEAQAVNKSRSAHPLARKTRGLLHTGHPTQAELAKGLSKEGRPVSRWNVWCDQECRRLMTAFTRELMGYAS